MSSRRSGEEGLAALPGGSTTAFQASTSTPPVESARRVSARAGDGRSERYRVVGVASPLPDRNEPHRLANRQRQRSMPSGCWAKASRKNNLSQNEGDTVTRRRRCGLEARSSKLGEPPTTTGSSYSCASPKG
jgi:hypothetical protein